MLELNFIFRSTYAHDLPGSGSGVVTEEWKTTFMKITEFFLKLLAVGKALALAPAPENK